MDDERNKNDQFSLTERNERAQQWIELAKMSLNSIHNRRKHEWKLAIGFWAGIGTFTAFVLNTHIARLDFLLFALVVLYALIFITCGAFWFLPQHRAHEGDKKWQIFYASCATAELCGEDVLKIKRPPAKIKKLSHNNRAWYSGQIIMTILGLALSWLFIYSTLSITCCCSHLK